MKNLSRFPILTESEKNLPYYVVTVGYNVPQYGITRENGLDEYQIMLCREGVGKVMINGMVTELKSGDVLFMEKNTGHWYKNVTDVWITDWITYDGIGVPYASKLKTGIYRFENFDEIASVIETIAGTRYGLKWAENTTVLLYRLLLLCNTTVSTGTKSAMYRLKPAVSFIENNFHRDISLEEIATVSGVTKEHLCVLFQSTFGMRPFEYVTKTRIQKAKELLASRHDLSLGKISSLCGFNSAAYFALKFRQYENITPSQFRQEN